MVLMLIDESLLVQVEFKTTGSNIHSVRNAVSCYRLSAQLVERKIAVGKDCSEEEKKRDKAERLLRAFVVTGCICIG